MRKDYTQVQTIAKDFLSSKQLLVHYDPAKKLVLSCDTSSQGIGAVLSHVMGNGEEQLIAGALAVAEKKYSQLDKEALSIIFAVKWFHQYLYGWQFTILMNHKPLIYLFNEAKGVPNMASTRLIRWALSLCAYQYLIVFHPGKQNGNADALSRLPLFDHPADVLVPGDTILF